MAHDKTPFASAVREFAAQARGQQAAISPDELLAYHRGELSAGQAEELRERLAVQPEAVRTIQDLNRFPDLEPADESRHLDAAQVDTEWRAMQARLAAELDSGDHPVQRFPQRASGRGWSAYGLVAALLLISLGLSLWVVLLRRTVHELSGMIADLSGPRVNVLVSSLIPQTTARDSEPTQLSLPPASEHLLLILNLPNLENHSDYRVAISTGGGEIWSRDGLERSPLGNFTIELSRSDLPPGDYRVDLSGLEGGGWQLLATYRLRLRPLTGE